MFGGLAFFGFVFFLFISKEEISGHQPMQLATPRSKVGRLVKLPLT